MKPIRTPESDTVYTLPGGNEDNFLHAQHVEDGVKSVWRPSPEELALLYGGGRVVLMIYGSLVPPVSIGVERPFCPKCREQMPWDEDAQRYACGNACAGDNGA